jgi:hypothetical protein
MRVVKSSTKTHYIRWFAQYRWRSAGVLTFKAGQEGKTARRLVEKFIREIESAEGHRISWVAIPERGTKTDRFHFHVLIAGIASRIRRYTGLWEKMAGHCALLTYDPHHPGNAGDGHVGEYRGIAYALKSLTSDDYEILGQLHPEHLLVRHRRALARSKEKSFAWPEGVDRARSL